MLVLKRKNNQWVELTHRSGDTIRIRVQNVSGNRLDLVFDDPLRNFAIERPERNAEEAVA